MSASDILGKKLDGRYELVSLCGVGGMANVYKATDLENGNTVAVKILRDEFLSNEELVRRFKNESKAISLLSQKNIVKVYDVSVSDVIQYIVMEYIDGMSLADYIERSDEKLKWKVAVFFIEQILTALSHAHEKGVVHRDIKPQNIMLLEDGTLKVMDFGIARLSRSDSRTVTEKAIGSVHYISPEQAKGDITDPKADIYSTGIILYEMLTGFLPFEADSAVSVAIKQISDTAVMPRMIDPAIPEALEEITMRAMAKEPQNRYQSAADMYADIQEFKLNPSIKFEYTYLENDEQTRFIDKVTTKTTAKRQTAKERLASSKKKSKKKLGGHAVPVFMGVAVAFAIGAAVLIFLIFNLSGNPLFSNKANVDLPNFIGKSYTLIQEQKKNKEIDFNFLVEEIYSDEYATGIIVDQNPKAPKVVKENAKIRLKVSKGVQIVTIPELYGTSRGDAEKALMKLGLLVNTTPIVDESVPIGYVVRTNPEAGTEMTSGSDITIFVSSMRHDDKVDVPSIEGLVIEDAVKILSDYLLNIGTTTEVESDLTPGTIITQSPEFGTQVPRGSVINILIAIPPIVVVVPEQIAYVVPSVSGAGVFNGWSASYNSDLNMITSEPSLFGQVCRQNPAAGTYQDYVGLISFGIWKAEWE